MTKNSQEEKRKDYFKIFFVTPMIGLAILICFLILIRFLQLKNYLQSK